MSLRGGMSNEEMMERMGIELVSDMVNRSWHMSVEVDGATR